MKSPTIHRRNAFLMAAVFVYMVAVFAADLLTPLVFDVWVLYLPVILVPVWFKNLRLIIITALLCSALMSIDLVVSGSGVRLPSVLSNLAMGLIVLWLTAFAGSTLSKRSLQLDEALTTLQREIDEHKQTERALQQSEERLRLAMNGAGMGTWDHDLRTGKTIWSETQFQMLGYVGAQRNDASPERWFSLIHPEDLDRVAAATEQSRLKRTLFAAEYRLHRADNQKVVWLAVFGRFVYAETGEAVRFLGVSFEMTRRKELEREVLEIVAKEQRRIGQELHDGVGQELTGLGLMANALVQRLHDLSSEQQIADRLTAGIDRVHEQIRDLSRGLVPVQVEAKGLSAALDELATSVSQASGVQVSFDCPDWCDVPDHAAATQLFRIAQEAVSNALRHSQPRKIDLTLQDASPGLRLSVRDDGIGLHDRHEDADGMGLRIMRYRAEQIGGALQIGDAEGGGTVVTCTLSRNHFNDGELPEHAADAGTNSDR